MKKIFFTINGLVLIISLALIILQVIVLNIESTAGENLTNLLQEIETVKKDNDEFFQKISSASSITTISLKAPNYGLIAGTQQVISLGKPLSIAFSAPKQL